MIFSIKLPLKNINIRKWIDENNIFINSSLILSIFILLYLNNSYILVATVVVSVLLILLTFSNLFKNFRNQKTNTSYWTGQIAHLGIAVFALGIILNVTQSYSTEKEINSFQEFEFNNTSFFVYDSIEENKQEKKIDNFYEFEPEENEILENLLPRNISTQIFKAFLENAASEQGSRMTAMDNATRNAGDLVDKLTITYNRSRQAAITKELIEIISGAESL